MQINIEKIDIKCESFETKAFVEISHKIIFSHMILLLKKKLKFPFKRNTMYLNLSFLILHSQKPKYCLFFILFCK